MGEILLVQNARFDKRAKGRVKSGCSSTPETGAGVRAAASPITGSLSQGEWAGVRGALIHDLKDTEAVLFAIIRAAGRRII
jgi:hypothetical protein